MSSMTIVKPGSDCSYIIQKPVCTHESPQYPWFERRQPSFSLNSLPSGTRNTDPAATRVWICMQTVPRRMHKQRDPPLRKTHFVDALFANDVPREEMFTILRFIPSIQRRKSYRRERVAFSVVPFAQERAQVICENNPHARASSPDSAVHQVRNTVQGAFT
uniref:Uncharacterized protein n=1 Tax=Ixodes ricinus TaxID=34613 RepID=A0A131Y6C5_IXORI